MIVELVGKYEQEKLESAVDVFGEELGAQLSLDYGPKNARDFYLRLYAAVAKDIAIFAQNYDFDRGRQQPATVRALLAELESKLHNRDEHDEPMDDLFDPTEVLNELVKAGWDPKSANASGWTMLHDLAGDETMEPLAAYTAISWLLEHGANVNATDTCGVSPLHLAAITDFGVVSTLLEFGADKTLRTTAPTDIFLYAARGSFTVPAGSTAYDLAKDSALDKDVIAELICDDD
jgi:ankyrin repeat protein